LENVTRLLERQYLAGRRNSQSDWNVVILSNYSCGRSYDSMPARQSLAANVWLEKKSLRPDYSHRLTTRLRSIFLRTLFVALLPGVSLFFSGCEDQSAQPAQKSHTIGLITNNSNGLRNVRGFQAGLKALGYVEGENVRYLFSGNPTPKSELQGTIESMVAGGAALIFTAGTPTGVAAHKATSKTGVPVVFGVIADPIAAGVMTDLTRPGSNMTGVMLSQNQARRLELLRTIVPDVRRILVPYNPEDAAPTSAMAQIVNLAEPLGLDLVPAHARNDEEVMALLANLPDGLDAIFMLPDSTVNRRVKELLAIAADRRIPVSGPSAAQVEAGAVMSYGIVHEEVGRQAAQIANRILRGAAAATTPVETAGFFLIVNVAAAQRIGLELSEGTLQQADRIVRNDRYGK
jgi:putative ABC transport system substrate-binding protein